jgi:hypothetical protein
MPPEIGPRNAFHLDLYLEGLGIMTPTNTDLLSFVPRSYTPQLQLRGGTIATEGQCGTDTRQRSEGCPVII